MAGDESIAEDVSVVAALFGCTPKQALRRLKLNCWVDAGLVALLYGVDRGSVLKHARQWGLRPVKLSLPRPGARINRGGVRFRLREVLLVKRAREQAADQKVAPRNSSGAA
jgi:hypothetical protein